MDLKLKKSFVQCVIAKDRMINEILISVKFVHPHKLSHKISLAIVTWISLEHLTGDKL